MKGCRTIKAVQRDRHLPIIGAANMVVIGDTLKSRMCALHGVVKFAKLKGSMIAQLDPDLRDPQLKTSLCSPVSTMIFFAGVVADSKKESPLARSVAIQLEPQGRLRVITNYGPQQELLVRLDGIVYYPFVPFSDVPTNCVPHCFGSYDSATNSTSVTSGTGCVKYCAPLQSGSNCRCEMVKRIQCWSYEGNNGNPTLNCGQFKELVRTQSFDGQSTSSCSKICAQQLATF